MQFKNFVVGNLNQYVRRSEIVLVGKEINTCCTILIIWSKYKSIK